MPLWFPVDSPDQWHRKVIGYHADSYAAQIYQQLDNQSDPVHVCDALLGSRDEIGLFGCEQSYQKGNLTLKYKCFARDGDNRMTKQFTWKITEVLKVNIVEDGDRDKTTYLAEIVPFPADCEMVYFEDIMTGPPVERFEL